MRYKPLKWPCIVLLYALVSTQSFAEDKLEDILMGRPENTFDRDQFRESIARPGRGSKKRVQNQPNNKPQHSGADVYFDMSSGIATTKFSSKDIEYIQQSPQPSINDTLKFVPGMRGADF